MICTLVSLSNAPVGSVCQQNIRIVDTRTGDGNTLYLPAGHLIGLFMHVVAKTNLFQHGNRPLPAFLFGYTRQRQRHFYIGKHALVRDQVVALEHEADGIVAVVIPIRLLVFFCGNPIDDNIAAGVAVQTTDDVEHGGLAGTALSENGDKLVFPERNADSLQGVLRHIAGDIGFYDIFNCSI